ncbi:hypothetical protein ESCO_003246 [Escovopsis weberi]|uniref:Uncharacterized protein n=1 Tax=Escovopsis weberi TaxID=150374 RepID=A0A0M8MSQ9_ESCWE|nr:hypothetical protein ESCO_003246 [Escovopsis weberi]
MYPQLINQEIQRTYVRPPGIVRNEFCDTYVDRELMLLRVGRAAVDVSPYADQLGILASVLVGK